MTISTHSSLTLLSHHHASRPILAPNIVLVLVFILLVLIIILVVVFVIARYYTAITTQ